MSDSSSEKWKLLWSSPRSRSPISKFGRGRGWSQYSQAEEERKGKSLESSISHLRIDVPVALELFGKVSAFYFCILASYFSAPSQLEIQPRCCYRCWGFSSELESMRSTLQTLCRHDPHRSRALNRSMHKRIAKQLLIWSVTTVFVAI